MILPALTCLLLSVPAVLILYRRIRPLFSVKVNCWFCDNTTVVPYGNINCWDCPACEQYNGFKEDGDYNKPIPAQYDEALNFASTAGHLADSSLGSIKLGQDNELCSACNYHQLVKIRLLANFTPTSEDCFDSEVEEYQRYLEEVYALCSACTQRLRHRLSEQDSLLRPLLFCQPWYRHPWQRTSRRTISRKERVRLLLSLLSSVLGLLVSLSLLLVLLGRWSLVQGPGGEGGLTPLLGDRPPSPLMLRLTGLALAAVSVLLAGPQRFGAIEIALCWFWLLLQLVGLAWTAKVMEHRQLLWLRTALTGLTAVLGTTRTTALLLLDGRRRGRPLLRKFGSPPGSSLSSSPSGASGASLSSGSFTSLRPDWETKSSHTRNQSQTSGSPPPPAAKPASAAHGKPLHDLLDRIHISRRSKRFWGPPSELGGNFQSGAERPSTPHTGCALRPASPLLWPPSFEPRPRLSTQESSRPAWDARNSSAKMGHSRSVSQSSKGPLSTGESELLWGVKQAFDTLTPPPSIAGSTTKDFAASTSQTMQASLNSMKSSGISPSSTIGLATSGSPSLASPSLFASERSAWTGRSPSRVEGVPGACSVRHRTNGYHDDEKRSYVGSSVSQNTRCEGEKSTLAACQVPVKKQLLCGRLLLVFSVGANMLLFAYFVVLPGIRTAVQ